jgi:hypothetical protein
MTLFSPKYCLAIVVSTLTIQASAQKTTINKDNNGKLLYSYNKSVENNNTNFDIRIYYKKEQVIYKEEIDSIVLHNTAELNDFTASLQKVIQSFTDENMNPIFEKTNYILAKTDKGMSGIFITISNRSGTVVSTNTKSQGLDLLEWLKSINFGKE